MDFIRKIRDIPPVYFIYTHSVGILVRAYKEKKKRKIFKQNGLAVLRDFMQLAEQNGTEIMCVFGTLLGIVRDNGLIPFDFDIDTAILDPSKLKEFMGILFDNRYTLFREFRIEDQIVLQTWQKDGIYIDMFQPQYDNEGMFMYSMWRFANRQYKNGVYDKYEVLRHRFPNVKAVKKKHIYDFDVLIPENDIEVVECLYGKAWKIPDPNFKHTLPEKETLMVKETYNVTREEAMK